MISNKKAYILVDSLVAFSLILTVTMLIGHFLQMSLVQEKQLKNDISELIQKDQEIVKLGKVYELDYSK